ncbi:hypothetical protein HDE_02174 [Halotydeus destructor]|nr:hypothetical protein HDE_02174 [Halotydeus destructor]
MLPCSAPGGAVTVAKGSTQEDTEMVGKEGHANPWKARTTSGGRSLSLSSPTNPRTWGSTRPPGRRRQRRRPPPPGASTGASGDGATTAASADGATTAAGGEASTAAAAGTTAAAGASTPAAAPADFEDIED